MIIVSKVTLQLRPS